MSRSVRWSIIAGFATIYTIWGSTYLAIRLGVDTIPPFMMAGARFTIGGLLLYLWVRSRGAARPKPIHWLTAAVLGLLMAAGANGLVTYAEVTVPSGITALIVAMVPMWIVLFDWIRRGGTRPTLLIVAGLILGFFGVAMLINPTDVGNFSQFDKAGALLVVLATIMWASGSVYSRHAVQPESKMLGASMQMITGGIMLFAISGVAGEYAAFDIGAVTMSSALAWAYLTVVGSLAYAVYIWLLKASTPAKVATYAYVNPIIALILGSVVAGEALTAWIIGCSLITLIGVGLIVTGRKRIRSDGPAAAPDPATVPAAVSAPVPRCDA
jgi:drug/metabolite transporter (DMT)-like permease